ncbi:uncharacterized protein F5891DRAFT_987284 [Suillus fuscotomentosus]|uniref:Uncharacterized protein n=1 Tax=Suillus fuscotomentosus TaxID=1912939 RepID=A0AAD4DQH3_9AGAM|nr:uncharacterized protein F5891DRAFT_987284 [Suillus fuscotomentosus]KAG1889697.1 hypothetical protein F5891DRAFT_987284 [Suillus fuscotomentosus]
MPTSLTLPLRAQSAYYDCSQPWKSQPSTPQQKRYSLASGPPLVKHHSTPSANCLAIQSSTDTCTQFETRLQISTLREPSAQEINKGGAFFTRAKTWSPQFPGLGKESRWLQLWGTEVSYSETRQDVLHKLQDYVNGAPNIVALTLFDIKENVRHSPPKESSRTFDTLNEVELVVPFHKWIHKSNKSFPGPVTMFRHNWVSAVTVTVTTWLHRPTRQLNLNDHDNEFYQYALAAEDTAEESSSDESSSDGSSSDGSNSDESNSDDGLKQTGYDQYSSWHEGLLKRKALEMENMSGGGSTKRSRKYYNCCSTTVLVVVDSDSVWRVHVLLFLSLLLHMSVVYAFNHPSKGTSIQRQEDAFKDRSLDISVLQSKRHFQS